MTGSVTTEALVEALAHELARLDGWQDPNALWTDNLGIIARGGEGSPVYLDYVEDARALVAGPLAPLLAAHQQVTAERDEARNPFGNFTPTVERIALLMGRVWLEAKGAAGDTVADFEEFAMLAPEDCADCCTVAKAVLAAVDPAKANERADAAEASLATATSELARLRAEGEAKDRALLLLLPFVDYAAGEGLMFVETEDGEHPEMDAADIMGFAAEALGLELGSDAYLALLPAGYDAIRAARAATAREEA